MWKRTNKKIATILVIILGIFIVSCKNPLNFKQEAKESQKAYISISANLPGSNARTVLPTAVTDTTTGLTWELKGKMIGAENEKTLGTWKDTEDKTAYQQMIYPDADSGILLDVGNWQFTLTVSNTEGKVLEATLGDESNPFEITKDGQNKLEFVMQEATGDGIAGGQIDFTLKWKELGVVEKVIPVLYKYTNDNFVLEAETLYTISKIKTSADKTNEYISFTNKPDYEFAAGYYKLELNLQQKIGTDESGSDKYETINTYTCLIRVAPGLLSSGSYTLESLANLYPVTFDLNDGYLDEYTTTLTVTYNKYQKIDLPIPEKSGYSFEGWYTTSDFSGEKIEGNYYLPYDVTDDGVTLYAKWERELSLNYTFAIGDQDSTPDEVSLDNAIYSPYDNKYGILTITNPNNSSSVWDYYVRTNRSVSFSQEKNYSVSVDLKSEGGDTVVGIQAAYADMFFTVGTDWTTCTFETGFLDKELPEGKNGITIGSALASKVYISNLVITEIDDDNLPTLAFNVTKTGINEYLANGKKAENIIEVEKISSNDGYQITLNTDVLNVDLTIRDYATPGLNKTSFNISLANTNDSLQTSMVGASLNSEGYKNNPKVVAWTSPTDIPNDGNLAVYFPAYANNEGETLVPCAIEGIFSGGNVSSTMTIKNIKMEKINSLEGTGKVFAIKTQEQGTENIVDKWEKSESLPFSPTMNIPSDTDYYFDVLILDSFEDASKINWDDCIRFLYSTSGTTTPDGKFNYSAGKDNNNDVFKIHNNNTNESCTCKITLTEDLRVLIEEDSSANNDTSSTDEVEGISYASINDIDTFYISDSNGLNAYRDLINGIGGFSLSITPSDGGVPYNRTFETGGYNNYNAILVNDIEITDAWIPIGTSDHPFKSSFDGQGHSITFAENSSFSGDYAGVFGYVGNQSASTTSISNLVVKGQNAEITTSAQYAGGIVAYSYGATISNCVNKLKINNTYEKPDSSVKEFGTGGIVGFVKKDTKIEGCVNFAELVSKSSVGGIIGKAYLDEWYEQGELNIQKCINLGTIKSAKALTYVSAFVGYSHFPIEIKDCIHLGKITYVDGSSYPYHDSGFINANGPSTIYQDLNHSINISNCINASSKPTGGSYGTAFVSDNEGCRAVYETDPSNLYYDETIWDETQFPNDCEFTIDGKSTSELCALTTNALSTNWSCETEGTRYPLPDLSLVLDGSIWQEICEVAEIESSNNVQNIVTTWSELRTAITNASSEIETIITIGNDIELTNSESLISVSSNIKLISAGEVTISRNGFTGSLFNLSGGTLSLGDDTENKIIIDGNKESNSASYPFIVVPSGILNIYNGVILRNNNNTATNANNIGGGIVVRGGVVNIYGGTIKSCESKKGGGIYITSGELNLYGGEISSCISNGNGGGICIEGGTVTMQGGSIKNNEAKISSPANTAGGGGVYLKKNTSINISGGEIKENFTNSYGGGIGSNTGLGIVYITANPTIADNYTTEGTDSQNLYATTYINGVDIDNTAINEDIIDGQLQTEQTD